MSFSNTDSPARESILFKRMRIDWDLPMDLLGGTRRMRNKSVTWLPKEAKEEDDKYNSRVRRSFLYNAFKNTLNRLTARPFSRPVMVENLNITELEPLKKNIDNEGTSLTQFARNVLWTGIGFGLTHILVDFPTTVDEQGETPSKGEETSRELKPFWKHIKPYNLFFWKYKIDASGDTILTEIRFIEKNYEPDGEFGDKEVTYIIRYTDIVIQKFLKIEKQEISIANSDIDTLGVGEIIYQEDLESDYKLISGVPNTFGKVPLVTFYTNKKDFMTAFPPLRDLAETNLEHFQSSSDQRNILRFARLAQLAVTGVSQDEIKVGFIASVNSLLISKSKDAEFKYVEVSGKGAEVGRTDIRDLEERMETLGNQPLISRNLDTTATGIIVNDDRTCTDIQAWVRGLNNTIWQAYSLSADWINKELSENFSINIYDDFVDNFITDTDMDTIIGLNDRGKLRDKTMLFEGKRRGLFDEDFDIEEEIEKTENMENTLILQQEIPLNANKRA